MHWIYKIGDGKTSLLLLPLQCMAKCGGVGTPGKPSIQLTPALVLCGGPSEGLMWCTGVYV